jgi:hypothetical protein
MKYILNKKDGLEHNLQLSRMEKMQNGKIWISAINLLEYYLLSYHH